jgi:hypothetical protein
MEKYHRGGGCRPSEAGDPDAAAAAGSGDRRVALKLVTPAEAVAPYKGPPDEAEHALARVIHVANKGLAHCRSSRRWS